jgi:hypothetical protein
MHIKTGIAALTLGLLAMTPAMAQTNAPESKTTIPEKQSATTLQGGRSESLSSKLSNSDGVITPKGNIDPGMHVPAPDPHPNSTTVIPPSATGGANAK